MTTKTLYKVSLSREVGGAEAGDWSWDRGRMKVWKGDRATARRSSAAGLSRWRRNDGNGRQEAIVMEG